MLYKWRELKRERMFLHLVEELFPELSEKWKFQISSIQYQIINYNIIWLRELRKFIHLFSKITTILLTLTLRNRILFLKVDLDCFIKDNVVNGQWKVRIIKKITRTNMPFIKIEFRYINFYFRELRRRNGKQVRKSNIFLTKINPTRWLQFQTLTLGKILLCDKFFNEIIMIYIF